MQSLLKLTAVLLGLSLSTSACTHSGAPTPHAERKEGAYVFKVIVPADHEKAKTLTEDQRTFIQVTAEGKVLGQGRPLGELITPLSVGKEGKVAFRLKKNGSIVNEQGQILDAQMLNDTLEFKGFMNNARMRLSVENEHLFVAVQSPAGDEQKEDIGRIIPFRKEHTQRVLWLSHYVLLQSFKRFACQAKQTMAQTSLMLVRQQQEVFRLENARYGRSLTEIAFQRNNPHYNIELIPQDDDHYLVKATSVQNDDDQSNEMLTHSDEWSMDQDGKIANTDDGCR